jgi:hypothetical protein
MLRSCALNISIANARGSRNWQQVPARASAHVATQQLGRTLQPPLPEPPLQSKYITFSEDQPNTKRLALSTARSVVGNAQSADGRLPAAGVYRGAKYPQRTPSHQWPGSSFPADGALTGVRGEKIM